MYKNITIWAAEKKKKKGIVYRNKNVNIRWLE